MASYADIAYAQTIFDEELNTTAWDLASNSDRNKALSMATKMIDKLTLKDDYIFTTKTDPLVTENIKLACVFLALELLDGRNLEKEYDNLAYVSQTFNNSRIEFDPKFKPEHILNGIPSIRAWHYLKPLLKDINTIKLERVS